MQEEGGDMTTEQAPLRNLRSANWLGPSTQVRQRWQGWRRAFTFPVRLPLVLWWAVLMGVMAFGSFLNVYISARISDARIQLARLDQDLTLQEEVNSELLFRIGKEVDLNHISIWAQNQGFIYQTETLWLDLNATPIPPVGRSPQNSLEPGGEFLTSESRFQGAVDALRTLASDIRAELSRLRGQISGFTPLPPETRRPNNRVEAEEEGLLGRFWNLVLEAVNASVP